MLSLLGGWQLTSADGRQAGVPVPEKGRALLAYLATENRWHYRETLGELLWPDSPSPRANLRQALSILRAALDDDNAARPCLQIQRNAVRFAPDGGFVPDIAGFDELPASCHACDRKGVPEECAKCSADMERAVARYKGEFMAGFSLPDCLEFEAWLQLKRDAFRRHALSLLGRLADWYAANGAHDAALVYARRHVELEPWDEPGQRRLMQLYAAAGNHIAALRQFEAYSRELDEELGTAPDESTRALYKQLCVAVSQEARPPVPATTTPAPERLQVTVLYCEIDTAESDPEDIVASLREPTRRAIDIIRRNGGYHVESHGAGLLAYFGYPRPMENAAVAAARTASAISRAATERASARLGLHTGLIVTGDNAAVPDAGGQISSVAIRLCQMSAPGQIHLSGATHELISGYFRCQTRDLPSASGASGVNKSFLLQEETGALIRLDASARLTPLVGREKELACLTAAWHQPGSRAVLLRGDPGIGKSRLLRHFRELAEIQPAVVREVYCRPEYQNSAFHPLGDYLTKAANFTSADDDASRLDKLERYLSSRFPSLVEKMLPLLARLLSIPCEHRYAPPALSPQQEKESLLVLLLQMITLTAKGTPLLLIAEDIHWADPSTLDLLQKILDGSGKSRIFLLLTARPEFRPGWHRGVTQIDLAPLSSKEAATLVSLVDTEQSFPVETVARIVAATDGVPLFIEETARMFMARQGNPSSGSTIIPATLRDLLAARLDRLADAKHLAQICAVIGREFDGELLREVTPLNEADTARALHELQESGLVSRIASSDVPTYQFRHALIQEAAYQSQTRPARRDAHRRIARVLKSQATQWTRAPEVLAQHFCEAGDACEAIEWWRKAGTGAAGRGAVAEAIRHFKLALETIANLPEGRERDELELPILVELGSALIYKQGYGSLEADRMYSKAFALSEKCGASLDVFRSIWGLYLGSSSRTTHSDAMQIAERLLQLATQDGRPALLITAHYACANSSYSLARFAQTCRHMEAARRLYDPAMDASLLSLFGEHPFPSTLLFGAWALWSLGDSSRAMEAAEQAIAIARRVNHPQTLGLTYCCAGILHRLRGEPDKVAEFTGALSELATKHDFPFWEAVSHCIQGWADAANGNEQGTARISSAIAQMRSGIFAGAVMYFMEMLAESFGMLGMHEEQLRAVDEALEVMHSNHDSHFEAELYRLKGECLYKLSGNVIHAREWLEKALAVATAQGAKELEKRAAASLARLPANSFST